MNYTIPDYADKQQLFDWLRQNKGLLMKQKKASLKAPEYGFGIGMSQEEYIRPDTNKEIGIISLETASMTAKTVINATNIIDSHRDLHIPKIWNRSVKNNKDPLHLQEHKMQYDYIIADGVNELRTYTTTLSWKSLGWDYEGKTELLMHELFLKGRHAVMEDRYKNMQVKYHSVGMQYVDLVFCVDCEEKYWAEEKDNFDKYIEMAVNKEAGEEGYFWAVLEAKEIEGSAVVRGSCPATPTLSITEAKGLGTATPSEHTDPPGGTQKERNKILSQLKFI